MLHAYVLPETHPRFRGEAEPCPPTGLTDTWYRTSEVHTSSSPTTHGMASVRPFSSFKAWGEEERSDEHFLRLYSPPKTPRQSLPRWMPRKEWK